MDSGKTNNVFTVLLYTPLIILIRQTLIQNYLPSPKTHSSSISISYCTVRHIGNYVSCRSQAPSPPYKRKDLPPRIPAKPMKAQPLTVQRTESLKNTKYFSADGVIKGVFYEI